VSEERLRFTTDLAEAVRETAVIFIAVGTPQDEDGSADLTHVLDVARAIARAMNGYKILVNKSTVPVGTAARVRELLASLTSHPFSVVSNPEFLKEGTAVDDFLKPDRVVIGTEDPAVEAVMRNLYEPFVRTGKPILVMDPPSAELTKYAANAMLATRISFMNEMANYCDQVGADVRRSMGIGPTPDRVVVPVPGRGLRRPCFRRRSRSSLTPRNGAWSSRWSEPRPGERRRSASWCPDAAHPGGQRKVIGPPAFAAHGRHEGWRPAIIECLLAQGATVRAYDPKATAEARRLLDDRVILCSRSYDAVEGADALVLVTEWNEFREPDFRKIKKLMRTPAIFDGRNVYDPQSLKEMGFHYEGIGRR
jgi:UDPglucose 6-dehydrogenase